MQNDIKLKVSSFLPARRNVLTLFYKSLRSRAKKAYFFFDFVIFSPKTSKPIINHKTFFSKTRGTKVFLKARIAVGQ